MLSAEEQELLLHWCGVAVSEQSVLFVSSQAEEGEQEEPQQQKRLPLPFPDKVALALPQPPQAVSGAGAAGGLSRAGNCPGTAKGGGGLHLCTQCWLWSCSAEFRL